MVTLFLTHLRTLIEAFRGHSQHNHGGSTAIHLSWEELVSLALQRGFALIHGEPRVLALTSWRSAWKPKSLPFSLFHCRTGTENSIYSPGASQWCCKAHGVSADDFEFGYHDSGECQFREISTTQSWSGTRRQGETLTHWQEARCLLQRQSLQKYVLSFPFCPHYWAEAWIPGHPKLRLISQLQSWRVQKLVQLQNPQSHWIQKWSSETKRNWHD